MSGDLSKIAKYIVLREEGKTYQEIGDIFGISKQAVERSIKNAEIKFNGRMRKSNVNIEEIIYKGIYQIFKKDSQITVSKLSKILGHERTTVNNFLKNKNTRISIDAIKKLIAYSGMTFDELFELREEGEQE